MLARPEQTEARVDSQAERLERRFSDLVDTCSRFSREIVRDVGWNGGSAAVFDPSAANGGMSVQWEFTDADPWFMRIENGSSNAEQGRLETPDVTLRSRFSVC